MTRTSLRVLRILLVGVMLQGSLFAKGLEISLKVNKTNGESYVEGESILVTIQANQDCYVHLIYHDAGSTNLLIYPNSGSSKDGKTAGGKHITLGRGIDKDGFEFVVAEPFGAEMIRAYASTKPLPLPAGTKLEGGMIKVDLSMDRLDVWYNEATAKAGGEMTSATVLLKTQARKAAIAQRETGSEKHSTGSTIERPRVFGLVVGVSKYSAQRIRPLQYADADARLLADFLGSKSGAGIDEERLKVLLNEDATRENILDVFSEFLTQTRSSDLVFIYFAGHGLTDPNANATYFLSHDADLSNLPNTAVDQAELTDILASRIKAGKVVFFIDACHGGGLGLTGIRMRGANTVLSEKLLTEMISAKNGTVFFSASRAMEQSMEGPMWGGGHGAFTWHVVQGLRKHGDLNSDGRVTVDELGDYVYDKVKAETKGRQHPELKGYFDNNLVLSIVR